MATCRLCDAALSQVFVDLGMSPLSNAFLRADQLCSPEPFYPLTAYVCHRCLLVQLPATASPESVFSDYAYFSGYSQSWVAHARVYCDDMRTRFDLGPDTPVVEIGSNDGYLLQHFQAAGIPVLGIDPAANVAAVAEQKGIDTVTAFFGAGIARQLAGEGRQARLLVGNNVLAHVPDLGGFVDGLRILLAPQGIITLEFPHLLRLMLGNQFDTIYHEHFSYFSLLALLPAFADRGLAIVDVEELSTHGGSLRLYVRHQSERHPVATSVARLEQREREHGLAELDTYDAFAARVPRVKRGLLSVLIGLKDQGKAIAGYGAPAKGNTLLNYCGIRADLLDYVVDLNPHKQGLFLPGTHIPIYQPQRLRDTRPDYILILPWNLKDEIMAQLSDAKQWGARFIVPIPEPGVLS